MNRPEYKILLIDDDPSDYAIIQEYLSRIQHSKYTLDWVADYEDAEKILVEKGDDYEAILVDYYLGSLNGLELIKKFPRLGLDTPGIVLTGRGDLQVDKESIGVGAADYLPKDKLDGDLLDLSIRHAIERKHNEKLVIRQQMELDKVLSKVALSELAETIIHEINNPLTVVQGAAMRILQQLESGKPDVLVIRKAAEMTLAMIYRIIKIKENVKRLQKRKGVAKAEEVNLKDLVSESMAICEKKVQHTDVELSIEIPPSLIFHCYPIEISQLLINLVCNACDAVANLPQRWIKIAAFEKGENVHLSVTDSGTAPDEATRQKMFDNFFTTKEKGDNFGIGLSLVKRIASEHGGEVQLDKSNSNTSFLITLPKCPPKPSTVLGRVLLVDDELEFLNLVKETFASSECTVDIATDGSEAVQLLMKNDYDVVVTDINMPGMGGLDLYNLVHAEEGKKTFKYKVPEFFFMTGKSAHHGVARIDAKRVFHKPFSLDSFRGRIFALLQTSEVKEPLSRAQ